MKEREILTNTAFGRRMGQKFKKSHGRGGVAYYGIGTKCDGLVTGFEANAEKLQLMENSKSHVGDLSKIPSQPVNSSQQPITDSSRAPENPDGNDVADQPPEYPTAPCSCCGCRDYHLREGNPMGGPAAWLCDICHPEVTAEGRK